MAAYKAQVLLHALEERWDERSDDNPGLRPGERLFREMVLSGARALGDDQEAFEAALKVVLAICRSQYGERFRVPGLSWLDAWARDLEIAKRHNGRNKLELARHFNVSTATVEVAVRKYRRRS